MRSVCTRASVAREGEGGPSQHASNPPRLHLALMAQNATATSLIMLAYKYPVNQAIMVHASSVAGLYDSMMRVRKSH